MKNLLAFVLATSAILGACSDDDPVPSDDAGGSGGKGGSPSTGGGGASTGIFTRITSRLGDGVSGCDSGVFTTKPLSLISFASAIGQ